MSLEVDYLEYEDITGLHQSALEEYGGLEGVYSDKLESTLSLPMSGYGDFERFPTIEEKAAAYLYYLAIGHCFHDGNKRTAYLSAYVFLDINGFDLVVDNDEVFKFMLLVADNKKRPEIEVVVEWIKEYAIKR